MGPDVIIKDNRAKPDDIPVSGEIVAFVLSKDSKRVWLTLDTGYEVMLVLDTKFAEVISEVVSEEVIERLEE
ncbi:hypothetical protein LCGC14_0994600 [marine sediment metagenome]|uniref:Uncharacterized protein n=1 Tax=marine sediment metagenome TaxID=412755 RepID=A0A0F9N9F2_9ZZZZ